VPTVRPCLDAVLAALNARAAALRITTTPGAEQVRAVHGDMANRAEVEGAAGEIAAAYGRVDVLVNNAGACIHRPALEVTEEEWKTVLDVNITGVWNGCQAFGRRMVDAGGGVIVNVGSMSGQIVNRPQWQPAYNA
jgi:NAD(P)-dependent dehydrogenase (short-subunit alcohol dehydrogenase family)